MDVGGEIEGPGQERGVGGAEPVGSVGAAWKRDGGGLVDTDLQRAGDGGGAFGVAAADEEDDVRGRGMRCAAYAPLDKGAGESGDRRLARQHRERGGAGGSVERA